MDTASRVTDSAPAVAAGKPPRIGSHYQLFILCLILVGSQYGLFVIPAYIAILLGTWVVGVLNHGSTLIAPTFTQASTSDAFKHLCIIGAEYLQLACVWFVSRRSGFRPFEFIGISQSRKQLCLEVCLGIGLGVAEAIYTVLPPLLRHTSPHVDLLKSRSGEFILLVGVSLSAGFVEEIVYRGYLQRLLIDCLNNVWVAIGIQAVLFALAHLYEGTVAVASIAIQSLLTGNLAYRLRNLRLVIVAHCTLDLLAGLAGLL
jgi:membrane protease YdiL (CAAX protease family)